MEEQVWHEAPVMLLPRALFKPDLSLLRLKTYPLRSPFLVDRDELENALLDESDSKSAYTAAVVRDLLRKCNNRVVSVTEHENVEDLCCASTLPPNCWRALDISFLDPISSIKDPLTLVMSKAVPQKCMKRKVGTVMEEVFKESEESLVTIRQWLLCSLLGNYEFVRPSSRPKGSQRDKLYDWLHGYKTSNWETSTFLRLLKLSPDFLLFVCREHLVYQMTDIPSLKRHFNNFSNFTDYKAVVVGCMDEIRSWISMHLSVSCSPFCEFIDSKYQTPEKPSIYLEAFFEHTNRILDVYHKRLLDFSYRRPSTTALSIIRSLSVSKNQNLLMPLVQRPDYSETSTEKNADGEEGEGEGEDSDGEGDEEFEEEKEGGGRRSKKGEKELTSFDFSPYIPREQVKCINHSVEMLFRSSSLTPPQIFFKVLDVLQACGLNDTQTRIVKAVVRDLQTGAITAREYKQRFWSLREKIPHAYNLLQTAVELTREHQRVRVICILSADTIKRQLDAIACRFGTTDCTFPRDSVLFYYCHVCGMIYSLLRDYSTSYVNNYRHGLREAFLSYLDDQVHCRRTKKNHRGACGKEPLKCISLIGILLYYCGKKILLCPQPRCGMPMVLDSSLDGRPGQKTKPIFNEWGPMCYDCAFKKSVSKFDYGLDFRTRCLFCNLVVPHAHKMFLYPSGVILCNRCTKRYPKIKEYIESPEIRCLCVDIESTKRQMVIFKRNKQKRKEELNRQQWIQQTKRSRMRSRANPKR